MLNHNHACFAILRLCRCKCKIFKDVNVVTYGGVDDEMYRLLYLGERLQFEQFFKQKLSSQKIHEYCNSIAFVFFISTTIEPCDKFFAFGKLVKERKCLQQLAPFSLDTKTGILLEPGSVRGLLQIGDASYEMA